MFLTYEFNNSAIMRNTVKIDENVLPLLNWNKSAFKCTNRWKYAGMTCAEILLISFLWLFRTTPLQNSLTCIQQTWKTISSWLHSANVLGCFYFHLRRCSLVVRERSGVGDGATETCFSIQRLSVEALRSKRRDIRDADSSPAHHFPPTYTYVAGETLTSTSLFKI